MECAPFAGRYHGVRTVCRWSAEVLGGLRGTCKALEDKLDAIIAADGPTFSAADDRQA